MEVACLRGPDTDARVRFYLEKDLGLPLTDFPEEGVLFHESPSHCLEFRRIGNGAVFSGNQAITRLLRPMIENHSLWELYTPYGLAEMNRICQPEGIEIKGGGFHYTLAPEHTPEDVPESAPVHNHTLPDQNTYDKRFLKAFYVSANGVEASLSQIRWKTDAFIEIAVDTQEGHRGRGYSTAVVHAATKWIHSRGAVAHYPVLPSNIQSVRIARRLGYRVAWQEIYAQERS